MLRDPAFFWRPNNTASRGRGGGKNRSATKFRKNAPQVRNFLNSFVQDCCIFYLLIKQEGVLSQQAVEVKAKEKWLYLT